ncbi:MAG: hypothetical protein WD734_02780, partial [Dehalococcoidia bacterium]
MAHYLVVADEVADSPLLVARAREIVAADRRAAFTLLVLAQNFEDGVHRSLAVRERIAVGRAEDAAAAFGRAALPVLYTDVGDASPEQAVEDELRAHPDDYQAIVLASVPPGVSHWSKTDPRSIQQRHRLPVFPVFEGGDAAWEGTEQLRRMVALGLRRLPRPSRPLTDGALFTSVREVLPIVGLLLLHVVLGLGLALQYDRQFFLT